MSKRKKTSKDPKAPKFDVNKANKEYSGRNSGFGIPYVSYKKVKKKDTTGIVKKKPTWKKKIK